MLAASGVGMRESFDTIALSAYNIVPKQATVSGISSGGYMAVQVHVAFSATVNAAAIFAGGPFLCANGNIGEALNACMYALGSEPNIDQSVQYTRDQSGNGTIDNVENMIDDKVYLFSGSLDSVVNPKVVHSLEDYYSAFSVPSNINGKFDLIAEHTWPTLTYGKDCTLLESPFMGLCSYDGAGSALNTFFSDLLPRGKLANF